MTGNRPVRPFRAFAIVPAAGHSTRMGTHKLLLPLAGQPMLERVLRSWQQSRVDRVVVVARASDEAVHGICRRRGVELVTPAVDPPDMKASVQSALRHVERTYQPSPADVWLLAPSDMPQLQPEVMDRLLDEHDGLAPVILVPRHADRRGHPLLVPWIFTPRVYQLPEHLGVNALLSQGPVREVLFPQREAPQDVDTPEDYRSAASPGASPPRRPG